MKMLDCTCFLLKIGVLLSLQITVDATIGSTCTDPSTPCDTSNNEICEETTCVCNTGYYENETSCVSTVPLKPYSLLSSTSTETSVSLFWLSPDVAGYTSSYIINYSEQGGSKQAYAVGGATSATIPNLSPGTTYSFIVTRSITKDGRTQSVPESDPVQVSTLTTGNVYGGSCIQGKDVCKTGLECISSVNTCLCAEGSFYVGTTCKTTSVLKPRDLIHSVTNNSVTIWWNPPYAALYINSYVINYNELNEAGQTHTVNGQDKYTTVPNLNPGTTYIFTVVRSITREGRRQSVPASDPHRVTTATRKLYGQMCTAGVEECRTGLECISSVNMCLCAEGSYFKGTTCKTTSALKPYNLQDSRSHNSVTISWKSPDAEFYINSYVVYYNEPNEIVQTHTVNGHGTLTTVPNLNPGTTYIFTVIRSITREGRRQSVPASDPHRVTTVTLKVYGDSCTSSKDKCETRLKCISSFNKCLCADGSYYTGTTCTSTSALKPYNLQDSRSHNSVTISWKSPDAEFYINSYVVYYNEPNEIVQTHTVNGHGTLTTVPNLNPGTTYIFTVIRSITREGRRQSVPASDPHRVTTVTLKVYGDSCTSSKDKCETRLKCISSFNKCLCADGSYYTGTTCTSTSYLTPSISTILPSTTTSLTINWNSPPAAGYNNSYVIKYTKKGTTVVETSPVSGDVSTHLVTGIQAGTSYTFKVVRSITREGRTQTGIESLGVEGTSATFNSGGSQPSILQIEGESETDKSVTLLICQPCLLNITQGLIFTSGILVCAKGDCPISNNNDKRMTDYFDQSPNWSTSSGVSFKTWYRATGDDWLEGTEDSEEIKFVLGGENCGVQDQTRFCNGPLPVDRTYRVWYFICTKESCSEGPYLEFTLVDDLLSSTVIAVIVGAAVLVLLTAVFLVVYIKVVRPHLRRQRTQYMSDTSTRHDSVCEIARGNRMCVIQDGRPELVNNNHDSVARSEDTYDYLTVIHSEENHGYEEETRN